MSPIPRKSTPEEEALKWIGEKGDRFKAYALVDGELVVKADEMKDRFFEDFKGQEIVI